MTNISAFKIQKEPNKEPEEVVIVADSQSTGSQGDVKYDEAQKIFCIGRCILTHSGHRDPGLAIYAELVKSQVKGPEAIAKAVLDVSAREKISPKIPLEIIVAGLDESGKAKIFQINTTGFNPYFPEQSSREDAGMREQFYAFSGSGATFATRVIEGQIDVGLDPRPADLTQGVALMRAVAQAATKSAGVNDKLQYGLVTPKGIHTLFHPNINFESWGDCVFYFKRLLDVELGNEPEQGSLEFIEWRNANYPSWVVSRDLYSAFDRDLARLNTRTTDFRLVCDLHLRDKTGLEQIAECKERYKLAKAQADRAVSALLSGSFDNVALYLESERTERLRMYELVKQRVKPAQEDN